MAIFAWLLLSMLNFELSRNRFEFRPAVFKVGLPKTKRLSSLRSFTLTRASQRRWRWSSTLG